MNVLVALCTLALSLACLDMSISFKVSVKHPLSLSHTCVHIKKGDTPGTRTLNNSDTTNTESQLTHNEQRVWVAA